MRKIKLTPTMIDFSREAGNGKGQTYHIRYIEPDVNPYDDSGRSVVGDCTRVTFYDDGIEIDSLDFTDGQELVEEMIYWESH